MALPFRPVDAWVNPNFTAQGDDESLDVKYLFPGLAERLERGSDPETVIAVMDEVGVERAVITGGYLRKEEEDLVWLVEMAERWPDRIAFSLVVDPRLGMKAVATVRKAAEAGVRLIRMIGFETQLPYDHAAYFPVYAACSELGIPVGLNVGIPGPLLPGASQDPMPVDAVCSFFPDLKVVFSHGGEPWPEVCAKLLLKWPNLYYMSSAFTPRHIPRAIVDFMNTRGADKVMWASDFPVLGMERCLEEIERMEFRDEERRRKFARDNALRLFFPDATE